MVNTDSGSFFHRNKVVLVMIPLMGVVHWMWNELQKNPLVVDPKLRRNLQVYDVSRIN